MLVITRNIGETIYIGDDVTIQVTQIEREQVKLGIEAPRRIEVHREEIYRRINGDVKSKSQCVKKGI